MLKGYCTVKDLCRELGIGKNTAYKILKQNKIKSCKIAGKLYVREKDIREYVEGLLNER